MHRKNSLPVYLQLSAMLIRDIVAHGYRDGDRLAPERQLAKELGVTVTTLRKSLADLESKGFLRRVHGSGNYVSLKGTDESIYSFFRLELKNGGGLPTAELLDVTRLEKPDDLPDIGRAEQAFRFRRIRSINKLPVAAEEIWLDGRFARKIDPDEVLPSLYYYYRKKFGIWISEVEDRVSLSHYPNWVTVDEQMQSGEKCGFVERKAYAQNAEPVEYSRCWYCQDRADYVARIHAAPN